MTPVMRALENMRNNRELLDMLAKNSRSSSIGKKRKRERSDALRWSELTEFERAGWRKYVIDVHVAMLAEEQPSDGGPDGDGGMPLPIARAA